MPRRPATLSNCYVPLPLPSLNGNKAAATTSSVQNDSSSNKRSDGRSAGHELRRLCLETSVISRAMGSSLVELGHTKVLAEVHIAAANMMGNNKNNSGGPNASMNNEANNDIGSLKCNVKYAPHIGINQVNQRSRSVMPLDGNNNNNNSNSATTTVTTTVSAGKLNQELNMRESDLTIDSCVITSDHHRAISQMHRRSQHYRFAG